MSPSYGCFICGVDIRRGQDAGWWLQQFRILYSVCSDAESTVYYDAESTAPSDACVAHISGVGINLDNSWRVPLDEHMRWDDHGYVPQESDRVAVMQAELRHGFVLHDACWHLLRAALDPQPVPLGRLYRLCESLPISPGDKWLCWGHNYGGLLVLDIQDHLPGGHQLREPLRSSAIHWQTARDPYNVPEVYNLLALQRKETGSRVLGPFRESRDCFARIPLEIREEIAAVTPTSDALNLGLASRSFTDIMSSRFFWASRFAPGGERDFLFETRKSKQATNWRKLYQATDWKKLYQSTGERHASPALQHRMRIWKLIISITELLELRPESAESRVTRTRQLRDVEDPDLRWRQVVGDVGEERGERDPLLSSVGCRVFGEARAVVPQSLSRIAISVIQAGEGDYVAGLRLISAEDGYQQIGFRAEAKERSFAVTADALRGFNVAVGPRGIHALQVVCQGGTKSPWFGRPQGTPITERLVCATQILALDALFDGFKLVALEVAEARVDPDSPKLSSDPLDSAEPTLRAAALWFPTVPPQGLCLNDDSFVSVPPSISGYLPMQWILFGGCKGEHFPHLTGVSVGRTAQLHYVRFHYDGGGLQHQELSFGFRPNMEQLLNRGYAGHQHFSIDGKSGEHIIALAAGGIGDGRDVFGHINQFSFEITTNRGRSFHFHSLPRPFGTVLKPINIAPGTTIVGLFTCQHPTVGVIGLGAISAKVGA